MKKSSDTTNFMIDETGMIRNIKDLSIGTYELTVTVVDSSGNSINATFTLEVFFDDFIDVTLVVIITAIGGITSLAIIVMYRKEMGPFVPGTKNIVEPPNPDDIQEPEDIESESLE